MALPKQKDIEVPILVEIARAGGQIRPQDVYERLLQHFPTITPEDLALKRPKTNKNKWLNNVQWVRESLKAKGEIDPSVRGVWRITERGVDRLRREGLLAQTVPEPEPPPPPPAPPEPEPVPSVDSRTHASILREMLIDIGCILGKYAEENFKTEMFVYDVGWKTYINRPEATHVFEVQREGNLGDALFKLNHAYDVWGAQLFFIVSDEANGEQIRQRVTQLFSELFPRTSEAFVALTTESVHELHQTLGKYERAINKMVSS